MFTDHKLRLTSNWKVTAWRTWAQDCLYQRHTQYPLQINLTACVYDSSVNRTAESYFTTKVNKKSKAVRYKTGRQSQMQWCKLKVFTSKREDVNLMFINHRKEDGIYPLKRDSKAQDKRSKIYSNNMQKNYKWFAFSTYWEHNSVIERWNLIILTSLQDKAISSFHCYLSAPKQLKSLKTTQSVKYWKRYVHTTWQSHHVPESLTTP